MKFSWFCYASLTVLLTSCDKGPNLAQMCEDNPKICVKITEDNHCKRERNKTIIEDVKLKQQPSDKQKYNLLVAYESYKQCMGLASQIEHIKLKEKRTVRLENYAKVQQLIQQLADETKNSNQPELLYYHWTRFLDESALDKFLAMEGSKALESPISQLHLATYYAKKDKSKTIALLYHALELTKAEQPINPEIFHTLTSIFADKKEYKQAYIWLKILALYKPDDPTLNQKTIDSYVKMNNLDQTFLDSVAEKTLARIQAGNFKAPRH